MAKFVLSRGYIVVFLSVRYSIIGLSLSTVNKKEFHYYGLINGARGPYEEIFIDIQGDGPNW